MSDNPTDLLSQRHKGYRQAQERYQRATAAREAAHRLWPSSSRGWRPPRPATGSTLAMRSSMDSAHPSPSDSVRVRLEEAKREREALVYAEERAAGALNRLPREHKTEWLRAATRSLHKARAAYLDAIDELARARDQLSDEATLVSFLENDGQYVQAITGGIQRPGVHGTVESFDFSLLVKSMRREAAGVEEKARRDPNRPQPEPRFELAKGAVGMRVSGWLGGE